MGATPNRAIYRLYAPIYDVIIHPLFGAARRRAIDLLHLRAGERLLIPGVGTGLDLLSLPTGVQVTAADLNPAMLRRAATKIDGRRVTLQIMDATALAFPDACFDAVLLNLLLSVVPDGAAAFREAWRVLRPGGRIAIFDKFLPETQQLSSIRRGLGQVIAALGTDPNRRLSDILQPSSLRTIVRDEPSLLRGQYRIVLIQKPLT